MKQIELGHGKVKVQTIHHGERIGVILQPGDEARRIGEFTDDDGKAYDLTADNADCIIWLDNLDGARILQDVVNQAVLKMQGIPREREPTAAD